MLGKFHQIDMQKPLVGTVTVTETPAPGLYFDVSIEPAQDAQGKSITGYDVSVACDNPRSFFEETRDTLAGAGDFVRDCAATLVMDKFPDKLKG